MMLQAGKLNRRVILQRQATTQDAAGQPTVAWVDVATVWANVLLLNGLETAKADRPASIVKGSIRIRYRTDVVAAMRVLVGTALYEVQAVLPDESKHEYLDLVCVSVV